MTTHSVKAVHYMRVQESRYDRPTYRAGLLIDNTPVLMDVEFKCAQHAADESKAMEAEYDGCDDDYLAVLLRATDHPDLIAPVQEVEQTPEPTE